MLCEHHWNGNIRELRNVLERAMILARGESITGRHIILNEGQVRATEEVNLGQIISLLVQGYRVSLVELENRCINFAMEINNQNVTKTARQFGLSRATLRCRLDKIRQE